MYYKIHTKQVFLKDVYNTKLICSLKEVETRDIIGYHMISYDLTN